MRPRKRTIWLPFVRLAAFLAAFALTGQCILAQLHDPSTDPEWVPQRTRMRGVKQFFEKGIKPKPRVSHAIAPDPEPVFEPIAPIRLYDEPVVRWKSPLVSDWLAEREELPATLYSDWIAENSTSAPEIIADALFSIPEFIVDGAVTALTVLKFGGGGDEYIVGQGSGASLTERLLDIEQTRPRLRHPSRTFFRRLLEEEADYFADFRSSLAYTPGFEAGEEDVDLDELKRDQVKVLWDALKDTYVKKYEIRGERHLRSSDLHFREWHGVDFVVMPALLTAYTWYRGLEKKVKISGTKLRFHIEPVRRIVSALEEARDERPALIGVDYEVPGVPFRLIVTAGAYDGDLEVDFIGIGSSFGQVKQLMHHLEEE